MRTKWFVSSTMVLGIFAFAHNGHSQDDPSRATFGGSVVNAPSAQSLPAQATSGQSAPVEATQKSLKEKYLDLIAAQAALMDESTLQEEIKITEKNINELRALQKLNEAKQLLLSITVDFPESEAASQATRMLDASAAQAAAATQADFGDDIGPALNTASGLPFTRSSFQRELPPSKNQPRTYNPTPATRTGN